MNDDVSKKVMANVAQKLCSVLKAHQVRCVFCVPGTPNIALFHAFEQEDFKVINSTSELNAAFMANGYSRASGETGVIAVIGGPGLLEAIPGIAEAQADSVPLVIIVCHSDSSNGPRFKLHNLDHHAILRPLVKSIFDIKSAEEAGYTLAQAFSDAKSGEPGPVCVLVTPEILSAPLSSGPKPNNQAQVVARELDMLQVAHLATLIRAAKKISIIAGAGCFECAGDLRSLAQDLGSPVITTLTARGIIPEDHELNFYQDSSVGAATVINEVFQASDLILALGCKFSHNGCAGFTFRLPAEKLVHIDAGKDVLEAHYPATFTLCADVPAVLSALVRTPLQCGNGWSSEELEAFRRRIPIEELKQLVCPPLIASQPPQVFFEALRSSLGATDMVVTDTGLHQSLVRIFYKVMVSRGLIVPSDFQCMGYGIPAAIGARHAVENRRVVAVIGDGAFLCSGTEIVTAVNNKVKISFFVFSDGHYGVIRLEQLRATGTAFGVDLPKLDLASFAQAVGANYAKLEDLSVNSISRIVNTDGVSIIEVSVTDNPSLEKLVHKAARKAALKRLISPAIYSRLRRLFRR